jgi:hypothetical protein
MSLFDKILDILGLNSRAPDRASGSMASTRYAATATSHRRHTIIRRPHLRRADGHGRPTGRAILNPFLHST